MGKNEKIDKTLSSEEARKILLKERSIILTNCAKDVGDVLKKHNCDLDISMTIKQGSIVPNIGIKIKDVADGQSQT